MDNKLSAEPNSKSLVTVVFFEPQTGLYKREDWKSNYYHYRLRNSHPPTHQYTSDWLDDNIKKATVGSSGLEYSKEFLKELEKAEEDFDKARKQMLALGGPCNVPKKLA